MTLKLKLMATMLFLVPLVLEMTTLFGQCSQIREPQTAVNNMVEGLDRPCLDVFRIVIVQTLSDLRLDEVLGQHRLYIARQILHLQTPYFVEELSQCHGFLQTSSPSSATLGSRKPYSSLSYKTGEIDSPPEQIGRAHV